MPARTPLQTFGESVRLLRTRRFGTFWISNLLSSIGTWAQQVAEPWLLLSLGASSFIVGLDAFAMNAPVWVLTLLGGILADRGDRRRIIVLFQSVQALCPTLIVILLLAGAVRPWIIVTLSLVVGITDALSMPSFQSIVPSIVQPDEIGAAIALNSTQFNLSRILGPTLAGVLMVWVGVVGCFTASAASYLPFILVAVWILPRHAGAPQPLGEMHRQLFAGFREIAGHPRLRFALLTVVSMSALAGPLVTFSPVLVKNVFHTDAAHFSTVLAAFGIGGLLGATGLLAVESTVDRGRLCLGAALAYGAVVVGAGITPWFVGLVGVFVLAGVAMTVSNASANTLLQSTAGPRLRGQTASLFMLAIRGGRSVGDLITGMSVSIVGVQHALILNGTVALLIQLALWRAWARGTRAEVASRATV